MKKYIISILCLVSTFALAGETETPPVESTPNVPDVAKISKALGQLMGKNLESMGIKFDIAQVIEGLRDASQGHAPLMSEMELVQATTAIQEAAFKEMAAENLKKTEEFLASNKTSPGIHDLEPGKIQYRIEKEGAGPVVDDKSAPLVRYMGKFLDGTDFGSSKEDDRMDLAEEELIPGFRRALIGMKEGEKRVVFIHPDLAFGNNNPHIPPNSLLTLELEVIKANSPPEKPLDSLSTSPSHGNVKGNPEIAQPFETQKIVR